VVSGSGSAKRHGVSPSTPILHDAMAGIPPAIRLYGAEGASFREDIGRAILSDEIRHRGVMQAVDDSSVDLLRPRREWCRGRVWNPHRLRDPGL